jgi:hypothetical protein
MSNRILTQKNRSNNPDDYPTREELEAWIEAEREGSAIDPDVWAENVVSWCCLDGEHHMNFWGQPSSASSG